MMHRLPDIASIVLLILGMIALIFSVAHNGAHNPPQE
jgi:hypothetical protein